MSFRIDRDAQRRRSAIEVRQRRRRQRRIWERRAFEKAAPVLSRQESRALAHAALRGKLHAPRGLQPNARWRPETKAEEPKKQRTNSAPKPKALPVELTRQPVEVLE